MKRLLLLLFMGFSGFLSAQNQKLNLSDEQIYTYLNEIYGAGYASEHPTIVDSFRKLLNNRIEFSQRIQSENEKYPVLSSFPLMNKINPTVSPFSPESFDLNSFNPLKYAFGFFERNTLIIRIDGTDYLMIVKPQ